MICELLGNLAAFEQVELDASGDSRDGGLAGLAGQWPCFKWSCVG